MDQVDDIHNTIAAERNKATHAKARQRKAKKVHQKINRSDAGNDHTDNESDNESGNESGNDDQYVDGKRAFSLNKTTY